MSVREREWEDFVRTLRTADLRVTAFRRGCDTEMRPWRPAFDEIAHQSSFIVWIRDGSEEGGSISVDLSMLSPPGHMLKTLEAEIVNGTLGSRVAEALALHRRRWSP